MGRIAMSTNPEAKALFRKILLASSALPGIFPPVRIQVKLGQQTFDLYPGHLAADVDLAIRPDGNVFTRLELIFAPPLSGILPVILDAFF